MPDKDDIDLRKLEETFVLADDAFWDDRSVLFGSESERTGKLFEYLRRVWNPWDRSGPCMYRGCPELSIRRSHTIHRAGSLERIAEGQHVLTPRLNKTGQISMESVGLNNASTFPGFCERHEQLFFEFESTGSISSVRHLALQTFRTLCREIARKRHTVDQSEKFLKQYREARTKHYSEAIKAFNQDAKFKSIDVKGDELEKLAISGLKGQKADLAELEGDLYDEVFEYISTGNNEPSLQGISLPFEVPISLSGFGVITYESGHKRHRALCPLGILPLAGETVVFIGAARKHAAAVESYREGMMHGFNGVNAMESWMTNGSDHWFIRPSAWAAIPLHRQEKIFALLQSEEDNIGAMLDFSILDDARRTIITTIQNNLEMASEKAAVLEMVERESAKITS